MNEFIFVAVFLAAFLIVNLSLARWDQWRGSVSVHEMSTPDIQDELQRLTQTMTEGRVRGVPVKDWVVERIGDLDAELFRRRTAYYRPQRLSLPRPAPLVPTQEQINQIG